MRFDILTLFPSMFSPLAESILGKAANKRLIDINLIDIRSFAKDKHKTADDKPYGGGQGMVIKADLVFDALRSIKRVNGKSKTVLLTPAGKKLDNQLAKELSKLDHLVLICGHYEGVDERVREAVDEEISIGDYVLTGG
jgi:tRNA (guanine37-N1)-methyltransferase